MSWMEGMFHRATGIIRNNSNTDISFNEDLKLLESNVLSKSVINLECKHFVEL